MDVKLLNQIVNMLMTSPHPLAVAFKEQIVKIFYKGNTTMTVNLYPKRFFKIWRKTVEKYERKHGSTT